MPNYKLTTPVRSHIRDRANVLAQRALDYALSDFPLTTMQVQYQVLDEATADTLRELSANRGIRTIERHTRVRVSFLRSVLPELRRGVVVSLNLPEWIVLARATLWGVNSYKFDPEDTSYIVPDLARLDAGDREKLITWLNRASYQQRLYNITTYTVTKLIDDPDLTPTVAHLQALWPMLCTLVDDKNPGHHGYRSSKRDQTDWRDRMRNPPRRIKPYQPEHTVQDKYRTLIKASDLMLSAGLVLAPYPQPRDTIGASVEHVEHLEGDWKPE